MPLTSLLSGAVHTTGNKRPPIFRHFGVEGRKEGGKEGRKVWGGASVAEVYSDFVLTFEFCFFCASDTVLVFFN